MHTLFFWLLQLLQVPAHLCLLYSIRVQHAFVSGCQHAMLLYTPPFAAATHKMQPAADLLPLPANLALVLLDPDVGVYTLAADQLKVAVAPISLLVFQRIHHCKIVLGTPACSRSHAEQCSLYVEVHATA